MQSPILKTVVFTESKKWLPEIKALVSSCFEESDTFEEETTDAYGAGVILLNEEGKVVAFAYAGPSTMAWGMYEISWVCTHPEYRNQGLGKNIVESLLRVIITHNEENKDDVVFLLTAEKKLVSFYKRLGFEPILDMRYEQFIMAKQY